MRFVRRHKRLTLVLVLLLATAVWAADTRLSGLTFLATATDDDLIYVVDDPNGTPAGYKIGREEFLAGVGDMLQATYDPGGDGVDGNDTAYGAAWNGDVNAPSMNAVYDAIAALPAGHDAVTLDPNMAAIFTMSTQAIDVNLASPTNGRDDAIPTSDDVYDFVSGNYQPTVTEGSLADSVIVSADIKDGTIAVADLATAAKTFGINFVIDGGGSAITTGVKGDIEMPFDGTITSVRLLADQSGSIVVDVWEDTYANFPPTDADTSTSATPPTITTATKSEDTTLDSWDTTFSAGDILRINVDSCTTITRCTISIRGTKS